MRQSGAELQHWLQQGATPVRVLCVKAQRKCTLGPLQRQQKEIEEGGVDYYTARSMFADAQVLGLFISHLREVSVERRQVDVLLVSSFWSAVQLYEGQNLTNSNINTAAGDKYPPQRLEGTDGIHFRDVHHGAQRLQGSAAAFANLQEERNESLTLIAGTHSRPAFDIWYNLKQVGRQPRPPICCWLTVQSGCLKARLLPHESHLSTSAL
ncbi:hypothetical protein EYF80_018844 [Liparis tanakae]|uniref:Uncharacterized protein n=1 Tax=Liparis tanakae TaxID=230148 RepID=A0A4Z2HYD0_9TELE|nr:hypothetical protein EYF80_018844 [Liparis tanakae]